MKRKDWNIRNGYFRRMDFVVEWTHLKNVFVSSPSGVDIDHQWGTGLHYEM